MIKDRLGRQDIEMAAVSTVYKTAYETKAVTALQQMKSKLENCVSLRSAKAQIYQWDVVTEQSVNAVSNANFLTNSNFSDDDHNKVTTTLLARRSVKRYTPYQLAQIQVDDIEQNVIKQQIAAMGREKDNQVLTVLNSGGTNKAKSTPAAITLSDIQAAQDFAITNDWPMEDKWSYVVGPKSYSLLSGLKEFISDDYNEKNFQKMTGTMRGLNFRVIPSSLLKVSATSNDPLTSRAYGGSAGQERAFAFHSESVGFVQNKGKMLMKPTMQWSGSC